MEFLVLSGIDRVVSDEFSRLSNLKETFYDLNYKYWELDENDNGTFRFAIKKALDEDPEPLADFEPKVKEHFKRQMLERAANDFKHQLQMQYEKNGG